MMDFGTRERKQFIERVSPFHRDESYLMYAVAWLVALVFGTGMPHEKGRR